MTFDPQPMLLNPALIHWLITAGGLALIVLIVSLLSVLVSHRGAGVVIFATEVEGCASDLIRISPRRLAALAKLTFMEAYRRKALAVFVVFALLFMFAGWFIGEDPSKITSDQVKVYISFVLRTISWLTLPMILVLSSFGIPEEIRLRSIHTVVTKPASRLEIVLGRIIGFSAIGTLILVVMSVVGWIWIIRQIPTDVWTLTLSGPAASQTYKVTINELNSKKSASITFGAGTSDTSATIFAGLRAATKSSDYAELFEDLLVTGGETSLVLTGKTRSRYTVEFTTSGGATCRSTASRKGDVLICRVPVYGELKFKDRNGEPAATGINTGDIWEFRSYIEGATKARAVWKFQNVGEHTLDSKGNLHLENQFLAFRSYKGDMKRSLLYDYQFINPDKNLTHSLRPHPVNENRGVTEVISRDLVDNDNQVKYDLIKDFVAKDRSLTVEVSCVDREQYLGMARPDLFIRMPDRDFASGFFKAVLGIELMMVLVVLLGVTASTFLKGPIASLLIFVLLILGGKGTHDFMDQLVLGRGHKDGFQGGGFFESIYRILTHMNPTTELPSGNLAFWVMTFVDDRLTNFLWLCKQVIPRLQYFNMSDYVSNGFDVPFDSSLLPCLLVTLGYMLPCILLGYFALRIRELESK